MSDLKTTPTSLSQQWVNVDNMISILYIVFLYIDVNLHAQIQYRNSTVYYHRQFPLCELISPFWINFPFMH